MNILKWFRCVFVNADHDWDTTHGYDEWPTKSAVCRYCGIKAS